jgi:hypothetical protein
VRHAYANLAKDRKQLGEGGLGAAPLRVIAGEDEHLGWCPRSDAVCRAHLWCTLLGQPAEMGVMRPDLSVEVEPARGDGTQAGLGLGDGRAQRSRAQGREMPDQRHLAGDRLELLAQSRRSTDDDGLQRQHGLGPRLDRGVAGHLEIPDHLRLAHAGLGQGCGLSAEHCTGGALGIEVVRLAALATQPAVGPADFVDDMALIAEKARQAGAI